MISISRLATSFVPPLPFFRLARARHQFHHPSLPLAVLSSPLTSLPSPLYPLLPSTLYPLPSATYPLPSTLCPLTLYPLIFCPLPSIPLPSAHLLPSTLSCTLSPLPRIPQPAFLAISFHLTLLSSFHSLSPPSLSVVLLPTALLCQHVHQPPLHSHKLISA